MSKIYTLNFGRVLYRKVCVPIREKKDILVILLESLKLLLLGKVVEEEGKKGELTLVVDKMSRLVFAIENKIFSFNFPFVVEFYEESGTINRIYDSITGIEMDSRMISIMISIFNQDILNDNSLENFYYELDSISDISNKQYGINAVWLVVRKLISFECGYLRYDYDSKHEFGKIHPLHHLDINFSRNVTYKIGLNGLITAEELVDYLDTNTDCIYII